MQDLIQASAITAGCFGASATPEIPGTAAALFEHRSAVACSPFLRAECLPFLQRGAQPMFWSVSVRAPLRPCAMRMFLAARVEPSVALRLVEPTACSLGRTMNLKTTDREFQEPAAAYRVLNSSRSS